MSAETGVLSGVSVAHERASVEQIERASSGGEECALGALLATEGVEEAFALHTCNRAEYYVVTDDPERGREVLGETVSGIAGTAIEAFGHEGSLRHLLRVACGLESLVLGEDQILGQFKDAAERARAAGGLGAVLEAGVEKAIHVGERARTETAIDEGVLSLGSAASALAAEECDLENATALVVGAGEMGTVAANALAGSAEELLVANRTVENAEHVAADVAAGVEDPPETSAVGLEEVRKALETADVVISATASPETLLDGETLANAGETLVIDIAQPRDVSPTVRRIDGIDLRDLDALEAVTESTREHRAAAAERVEAMIETEFENLLAQHKRQRADEAIAAMYAGAERTKERELTTALSKLEATEGEFTEEQREAVESLADALVGQLLAAPTKSLRDAAENDDWSTISTALQLFDPEIELPEAATELSTESTASRPIHEELDD